jgi:DNA primase
VYLQIYKHYEDALDDGNFKKLSYFVNHPNPEVAKFCIDVMSNPYELSPNWMDKKNIYVKSEKDHLKMSVVNSIFSYKLSILEKELQKLKEDLKTVPEDQLMDLLKTIAKKENQKKDISSQLGRTVLR